jgi:protease secretion system membrane fusion protein
MKSRILKALADWEHRMSDLVNSWNPYHPSKLADNGLEPVAIEESEVRKQGARWFLIAFCAFLVWSVTMPIDSGVPVIGTVVVSGYRKLVQHPTGGVVTQIFVKEGSKVNKGDILIKVNPLNTEANLASYELQYLDLLVNESRLKSERLGLGSIIWVPELTGLGNGERVSESKSVQQQLFSARRAEYQSTIQGLQAQIGGLSSAMASHRIQLGTLNEELSSSQQLAKEGYIPRSQANSTLRGQAEQQAALANASSEIAKIRAEMARVRTAYLKEIETQLSEIQKNKEAFAGKVSAARFDQQLSEIRAPVSGTVVGLKVATVGGVISGSQTLAEIVPSDGRLIAEIKVPPNLIDKIRVGLEADIRFVAFNQTTTPVIDGRVVLVGSDLQLGQESKDPNAPKEYYLAQVEVTADGQKKLQKLHVQPGMPVDVIIKTGERTFMSYFLKPLTDKLARSFKD